MTKQSKSESKHIVILHGWGSNPGRWKAIYENLNSIGKNFTLVHTPFLPGFDPKKPIKKPYFVQDYAKWLDEYLTKNNIKKPVIVGHSNGGRIAIYYASHYQNISQLVLISAAGIPNPNLLLKIKKTVFLTLSKTGRKILALFGSENLLDSAQKLLYKVARESDYLKATPVMRDTMLNLLAYNAYFDLPKIVVPTLCIWGENDTATPLWMGEEMHRRIQNSKLKILEGGHNIHIAHSKEVTELIKDFVS